MQAQPGICPNCGEEGQVATPCTEKACVRVGYHRVPRADVPDTGRVDQEIGVVLDKRYLFTKFLGEGGFGRVFIALQLPLKRQVAVKILKKDSDPEAHELRMRSFKQEADVMARLAHPNIVQIQDFGVFEGAAYLVLEYVGGARTLKDELKARAREARPLSLDEIDAILSGVLFGLEEAHAHNLIHRDMKPENVMLQVKRGHPYLPRILDFGLAKFVDGDTQSSAVMGTPAYMAPEQLTKRDPGPWTDLYALGVIAYELMTGRRPFSGVIAEILTSKSDPSFDVLAPIADLDVPDPIGRFLRRALSVDPQQRYRSALEFRTAMQQAFAAAKDSNRRELFSVDLRALVSDGVDSSPQQQASAPTEIHGQPPGSSRTVTAKPTRTDRRLWPWLAGGLAVAGGVGAIIATSGGDRPPIAQATATQSSDKIVALDVGPDIVATTDAGVALAQGEGRIVIVGDGAVGELMLAPYPSGQTVRPSADGRVRAGIYKVPGGTFISVPDQGTLWVRPDAKRGVMIGGLEFQLDTDIDLVGEADERGMSHSRVQAEALAANPKANKHFENRTLDSGVEIPIEQFLQHRDVIRKVVLHSDLTNTSAGCFRALVGRELSTHFMIDFDGTLYQTLDVGFTGYHAGELNRQLIGVDLNNRLANIEREPNEGPYETRTLPSWASATQPATSHPSSGPCRLDPKRKLIACTVAGPAFGFEPGDDFVLPRVALVFDGRLLTSDGDLWSVSPIPFLPDELVAVGNELIAFNPDGAAARSANGGNTWELVSDDQRSALPQRPKRGKLAACTAFPGAGGACQLTTTFDQLFEADAVVFSGNEGVSYYEGSYDQVTSDGGLTWHNAISRELAARYGAHPRKLSPRMELNGAKVRAYGYTDAQYRALGSLARTLASVFPAVAQIAVLDEGGAFINRALNDPAAAHGFLGHLHLETQRWDPGPGFEWDKLAHALAARTE